MIYSIICKVIMIVISKLSLLKKSFLAPKNRPAAISPGNIIVVGFEDIKLKFFPAGFLHMEPIKKSFYVLPPPVTLSRAKSMPAFFRFRAN
jgi:hypothetical protein